MTSSIQQMLSDDRIGSEAITVELSADTARPIAGLPVVVDFDYTGGGDTGITLPVYVTVTKPNGEQLIEREFSRMPPQSIDFTPVDPGLHLVRISERHHNRCFGSLEIEVIGDDKETE